MKKLSKHKAMKKVRLNYRSILNDVTTNRFCDGDDTDHRYCPYVRKDGAIQFPSGIVRPDGRFEGAEKLLVMLQESRSPNSRELLVCPRQKRAQGSRILSKMRSRKT